jgi:hypothetical protein
MHFTFLAAQTQCLVVGTTHRHCDWLLRKTTRSLRSGFKLIQSLVLYGVCIGVCFRVQGPYSLRGITNSLVEHTGERTYSKLCSQVRSNENATIISDIWGSDFGVCDGDKRALVLDMRSTGFGATDIRNVRTSDEVSSYVHAYVRMASSLVLFKYSGSG